MDRDPGLNRPATRSDIDDLFELILGRPLGNDAYAREIEATGVTAALLARALVESNEFGRRFSSGQKPERAQGAVADLDFSKPPAAQRCAFIVELSSSSSAGGPPASARA